MNPTAGEYFLHILHGQFSGIHFLISPLKEEDKDDFVSFLRVQWSNGLVVKVLDSNPGVPCSKTTGWLQGRLSRSSFRGRSNEYQ